ncbi:MAG TPA: bifunctional phosphoribosylaminoimidazolecarboxamide formyltransferase/IMP cyclohydrolase [Rectinemataceae bacterium]|nr:bifunctional phosphoribosylaminoimidazolecarboxamide formyltransferase/IMP cyclohydrolase [Rectinemataceae bacterium]
MPQAILSVHDKTGLVEFAGKLSKLGWSILASGGTAKALKAAGIAVEEIADYTGAPEILGGRVKTLHPAVHGGILARAASEDLDEIRKLGYKAVDLVVVNLYPFEKTVADPGSCRSDAIEQIDIGGVALIRAGAKNHERVSVICDIVDYEPVLKEIESAGSVSETTRRNLAAKAFARTASYDAAIAAWLAGQTRAAPGPQSSVHARAASLPQTADPRSLEVSFTLSGWKTQELRYGENPHQSAELYSFEKGRGPLGGRVLQGKELSYNNILDLDAAWHAVNRFQRPAIVVVKHLSPCGIAEAESADEAALHEVLERAIACDPISAYGGVIAANSIFTADCVRSLGKLFAECVAAPGFDDEALELLAKKKNLRLVIPGKGTQRSEIRTVLGGFLRQDVDAGDPEEIQWRAVSKRAPTEIELRDLRFAWKACMSVKSNAIVFAKGGATVGIGGGQPNRVDSVRIAAQRAGGKAAGSVLASDAFFPFPDSVEEAAKAGITAIAHPGGSIRDPESLEAADRAGIAMVLVGVRHFRH